MKPAPSPRRGLAYLTLWLSTSRAWAYIGLAVGGGASVAANIAHSYVPPSGAADDWTPRTGAVIVAGLFPVLLLITVEILARTNWQRGFWAAAFRYLGVLPVMIVAAVVSYRHMYGLLAFYGEDPIATTLGPFAIDGTMLVATCALLADRARTLEQQRENEVALERARAERRAARTPEHAPERAPARAHPERAPEPERAPIAARAQVVAREPEPDALERADAPAAHTAHDIVIAPGEAARLIYEGMLEQFDSIETRQRILPWQALQLRAQKMYGIKLIRSTAVRALDRLDREHELPEKPRQLAAVESG